VLLILMVTGLLTMAHIAGDDPHFAVEPAYYAKASNYDLELAQRAENDRLGWQAKLELAPAIAGNVGLSLELCDRKGQRIDGARVALTAFHNGFAGERRELELRPDQGRYVGELGVARAGLWEFRLDVRAGAERLTAVIRKDVGGVP
jgi:hypothetical protein